MTAATHGVMTRDAAGDAFVSRVPAMDMRPVEMAERCEQLGYHSMWFSDHVVTERVTTQAHVANASGKRAYPERPNLLDVATTIAACGSRTSTLRFAPGIHIAPYRHPLLSAHQFATLDVLTGGRLIVGVGAGWERGEFAALGVPYEHRGALTDEAIEIYRLAWTEDWIDYDGRHFAIHDVSMDPKPVQKPHPPIWCGGVTRAGARRAARYGDALYPIFMDAAARPERFRHLRDEVRSEADRLGRSLEGFRLGAFASALVTDSDDAVARRDPRPVNSGTAEQVLEDLAAFAREGYSHVTLHFDCRSGTVDELFEQMDRFAAEVLPEARKLQASALV